jgi:C4-dicarboxylate-specific signal transduction histidine kinase
LRWLAIQPPDLDEVRQTFGRIVEDGNRARKFVGRIHALVNKAPPRKEPLDINESIPEIIALTRSEVLKNAVSLRHELANGLPLVLGDRIQLQQVILNLITNAVRAMSDVNEGTRELQIGTRRAASGGVLVAVRDSGPGPHPCWFRPPLRGLLHSQARWLGDGAVDMPFDH